MGSRYDQEMHIQLTITGTVIKHHIVSNLLPIESWLNPSVKAIS